MLSLGSHSAYTNALFTWRDDARELDLANRVIPDDGWQTDLFLSIANSAAANANEKLAEYRRTYGETSAVVRGLESEPLRSPGDQCPRWDKCHLVPGHPGTCYNRHFHHFDPHIEGGLA